MAAMAVMAGKRIRQEGIQSRILSQVCGELLVEAALISFRPESLHDVDVRHAGGADR